MRRRRGFTFIELLLAISVMLVLMAISMPKMAATFKRGRLEAATRKLTATLRYARHLAILRGDGSQVLIYPKTGEYQLGLVYLDMDGEPIDEAEIEDLEEEGVKVSKEVTRVRKLPEGTFFSIVHSSASLSREEGVPRIIFYPDGSATAAKIGLQSTDGRAFAIDIFRTTGSCMVRKGKPVLPPNVQPLFHMPELNPFERASFK